GYSWAQIALARALLTNKRPLDAERSLRYARQFASFPTLTYELATVLASVGLYDEAAAELAKSFSLKDGQIEAKLAGRTAAKAPSFIELLALSQRCVRRSEEHTSELQSRENLVCRLLLEKKKIDAQ